MILGYEIFTVVLSDDLCCKYQPSNAALSTHAERWEPLSISFALLPFVYTTTKPNCDLLFATLVNAASVHTYDDMHQSKIQRDKIELVLVGLLTIVHNLV